MSTSFTDDDIAKLLAEKNNLENDLWSDDEGSEDEDKQMIESEHEVVSDCEGEEEEEREGGSNGRDDSDVTSGIIIRGRNGYEWSMNEPKKMGQPPRRNNVVVSLVIRVK
jgi:hypothetical protein